MTKERTDVSKDSMKETIRDMFNARNDYIELLSSLVETKEGGEICADSFSASMNSNRGMMWWIFSEEVAQHVANYTIRQYGDFPEDNMTTASEQDILAVMKRYLERYESNARGDRETDRDCLKLAHYASMLWCKRMGMENAMREIITEIEEEVNTTIDNEVEKELNE